MNDQWNLVYINFNLIWVCFCAAPAVPASTVKVIGARFGYPYYPYGYGYNYVY